ncbi:MAG: prepilin peptidase [Candidatus Rokubacteria bacterium]|nr:prepilin peptidase [Candidatus Rokubacteria bacterium]
MLVTIVVGLAIGSFLNVVIARLPEERGLGGRSACPRCDAAIAWYDNVPLLSFALLRARCRACRAPISWRYPVVEGVTATLFAFSYQRFGPTPEFIVADVLLSALVAITAIDLAHQIIPDVISLPGIGVGVVANLVTGRVPGVDALLGILVGGGIFWVIVEGSRRLMGREGMGGGDVKLGAMLGAFLGWKVALVAMFISVLLGGALAAVLLSMNLTGRRDPMPFGPFLAVGGAIGLFWGDGLLAWYLGGFLS